MLNVVIFLCGLLGGLMIALLVVLGEVYIFQRYKVSPLREAENVFIPKTQADVIFPVSHENKKADEAREKALAEGRDWVGLDEMYDA